MELLKCKQCGSNIPNGTKFCHNCGNVIEDNVNNFNNGQQGNNNLYVPKKNSNFVFILFGVIMVIGLLANSVLPYLGEERGEKQGVLIEENCLSEYNKVNYLSENLFYNNANKYVDKIVLTISTVKNVEDGVIKCDMNDDDIFFDFVFNMENEESSENVEIGKKIAIVGEVGSKGSFTESVTLYNCHIVAYDNCSKYESKLKSKSEKKTTETTNDSIKKVTKKKTNTKKDYIKSCKSYSYKKILRNPDKYDGKKIKEKIEILEVEDGLFLKNYIGMDDKENMYIINEERKKEIPRLYKGDLVVIYGNLYGLSEVESYIETGSKIFNLLQEKKQKTVVEIDMKYAKLIKG